MHLLSRAFLRNSEGVATIAPVEPAVYDAGKYGALLDVMKARLTIAPRRLGQIQVGGGSANRAIAGAREPLGATNHTYAEATRTQRVADWIGSHVRAFAFFGGVPRLVVPDQLRTGITGPCRYEPGLQRSYEEMAQHYGTAVLPARPGSPRDKAKVEAGVLVAQRWILARLRNQTFFSLPELNARIAELLGEMNDRPMRLYGASRRELFERRLLMTYLYHFVLSDTMYR